MNYNDLKSFRYFDQENKDSNYFLNRYLNHPIYKYLLIGFYFDESRLLKAHLEFLLGKHFEIEDKKALEKQAQYDNKERQKTQQVNPQTDDEAW